MQTYDSIFSSRSKLGRSPHDRRRYHMGVLTRGCEACDDTLPLCGFQLAALDKLAASNAFQMEP